MAQPLFECPCGHRVNVVAMRPGDAFFCPRCERRHTLAEGEGVSDSELGREDVFGVLLRRRLARDTTVELVPSMATAPGSAALGAAGSPAGSPEAPPARIGRFRVDGVLGRGGMGVVYRCYDADLERIVAVKVLDRRLSTDAEFQERFRREARAAAALSHPNITTIYETGEDDGRLYFAMEWVDGPTLQRVLKDRGRLPAGEALRHVRDVAEGLRAAARLGIIHRDVKPSNVLIPERGPAKVTDFGLAKALGPASDLTASGVILGTPLYMAPEQGSGGTVDHRSDIYALGATLYHLICGVPPFTAENAVNVLVKHLVEPLPPPPAEVAGEVSDGLWALIRRMTAKRPEERYRDHDELLEDVDRLLAGRRPRALAETAITVASGPAVVPDALLRAADRQIAEGRHDKALVLLRKVVEANPALRVAATLRLLELHASRGEFEECARVYATITRACAGPGAALATHGEAPRPDVAALAFAHWKFGNALEGAALRHFEEALAAYERIEAGPIPADVVRRRLAALREEIARIRRDLEDTHVELERSS
ncbi:MAG: protein kinase [Planctomycetes bacterium]|nr:protein kinase [Planctomycetota bacterium]